MKLIQLLLKILKSIQEKKDVQIREDYYRKHNQQTYLDDHYSTEEMILQKRKSYFSKN